MVPVSRLFIKDRTTEQTYPNGTRTAQIRASVHRGKDNRTRLFRDYDALCYDYDTHTKGPTPYPGKGNAAAP